MASWIWSLVWGGDWEEGGLNKLDGERNLLGIIYSDILNHGNQWSTTQAMKTTDTVLSKKKKPGVIGWALIQALLGRNKW